MNESTKNILSFDPVATTESSIGKRHEESIDDLFLGITWIDFIETAKAYGFKIGYCKKFIDISWSDEVEEEEIIFFHEEKGLILYAVSLAMEYLDNARVYGEVKIGDELEKNQWEALNDCFYGNNRNGTMYFNVDVQEDFRFRLDALSEAFEFSKRWTKVPFLNFLNCMDIYKSNFSFEEITKQKIDACTPEVRVIIFG